MLIESCVSLAIGVEDYTIRQRDAQRAELWRRRPAGDFLLGLGRVKPAGETPALQIKPRWR